MKIVQTFWSAPSRPGSQQIDVGGRMAGGWVSERYHAISWTLSCLKFRQFYPRVELYTDREGSAWLIDKLGLPYTDVHYALDVLDRYDPMLWALPKVYVYGLQNEPFIHADGDVFIWKRFDADFERSGLLAQNFESNHFYYEVILEQIMKEFSFIPDCIKGALQPGATIRSLNAGILGGCDTGFYHDYVRQAFEFVDRNLSHLKDVEAGMFNTVFEQLLLYKLAEEKGITIHTAFEDSGSSFDQVISVNTIPMLNHYVHAVGVSKQNPLVCLELEARLKYEFPDHHRRIADLYREQKIFALNFANAETKEVSLGEGLPATRRLLHELFPGRSWNDDDIAQLIDEYNEREDDSSEPEHLLSDLYQVEHTHDAIAERIWKESAPDALLTEIHHGLPALYADDPDAFLARKFSLSEGFGIMCLSHDFSGDLTEGHLCALAEGKSLLPRSDPKLALMENRYGQIVYSYLSEWDQLLYYFEDNELTGYQLIELIQDGDSPFRTSADLVRTSVLNFLVSQCFLYRRLTISELAPLKRSA